VTNDLLLWAHDYEPHRCSSERPSPWMSPERERLAHLPEPPQFVRETRVPRRQEPAVPGLCWCGRKERHQGRHRTTTDPWHQQQWKEGA
jgi:hypothetical protein